MYRTHTCGELRLSHAGNTVTLAGWVQRTRDLGGMTFVDLRDRYGITQLTFNTDSDATLRETARSLGREFVVQVTGTVMERQSKNVNIPTGEIEIFATELKVMNGAKTPPFTIEEETDGGDELRMKYRYLDLRRASVRKNFELRHRMAIEVRNYLSAQEFLEVETPVLIKSTPEGARDFVVPSRMNQGEFYALPQSPQTFKQLLMVAGMDRYFQIVFSEGEGADLVRGKDFKVFDDAELVVGIKAEGCAAWSRKQTDALIEFVKRPQVGATGIIFVRWGAEGLKSTVDKFYGPEDLQRWAERFGMQEGDLLCIMAGPAEKTRKALNELRLHLGELLNLRDPNVFKPLWVVDFPLLEKDEESGRWHAMHHPFTAPVPADAHKLESDPGNVKANAYDLVINGTEIGGGSIRIHDRSMQEAMFRVLGFTDEEARFKFGFLLDAFEYGAPPHGGAAFGFDRWVALFGGRSDIREFIAFPKNNAGRDVMIDAPSTIDAVQLKELGLEVKG
ncbi:MAG: aspartate--tRNA ligase [Flavobacteriales bacterium]|nr:aspartate--tRNA ligase [Flavobacteriales bacterium]